MSLVYFDTSALLRLCLPQPGSQLAARLWDGASAVLTSRLTHAEGYSALVTGQRIGLLEQDQCRHAMDHLERLWPALHIVELSAAVSDLAAELTGQYPLRGGDAIQVASAAGFGPDLILASWDEPIRVAGAAQLLTVVPPWMTKPSGLRRTTK